MSVDDSIGFGTIIEYDPDIDAVLQLTYENPYNYESNAPPRLVNILKTPANNRYSYDTNGYDYQKIRLHYSNNPTDYDIIVFDKTRYNIRGKEVSKHRLEHEIDKYVVAHPRD